MHENVDVMLANIDKTEVLENKSSQLAAQAKTFHKSSREVKRHWCKQNAKMNILIASICILVIIIVVVSIAISVGGGAAASGAASGGSSGDSGDSGDSGNTGRRLLLFQK